MVLLVPFCHQSYNGQSQNLTFFIDVVPCQNQRHRKDLNLLIPKMVSFDEKLFGKVSQLSLENGDYDDYDYHDLH